MRKGTEKSVPCDVLRGSVAFANGAGVKRGYDLLMKRSHDEKDELDVLTLENYFAEPYNGYMDMCLQLRFGGEGAHVCELQLHLQEMMDYKYKVAHQMYTWDRRFAPAHEYTKDTYTGERNEAGERHGQGIDYFANGDKYEGQWEAGKSHGQGIKYFADGGKYEGQYEADKKHGQGILYDDGDKYEGQWEAGKKHGQGIYYFASGSKYEGQFEASKKHGQGIFYYASGNKYEGQWEADNMHGQGKKTRQDGTAVHDGLWKDNQPVRA
jgi:radial spoke head protein 1